MANFETSLTNLQRVTGTVVIADAQGGAVPVTGLTANQTSGDATISMTAKDGTQLPVEKFAVISGANAGDSTWDLAILTAVRTVQATVTAHVVDGTFSVSITFDAPEDK